MGVPMPANFGADTERHYLQIFICVNYFLLLENYKSIKISTQRNLHYKKKI